MKKIFIYSLLPLVFLSLFTVSCNNNSGSNGDDPDTTTLPPPEVFKPQAPAQFSGDSAYAMVEKQIAFGPRIPNSVAHEKCAKWLEEQMRRWADEVIVQKATVTTHDNRKFNISNIVASFNPSATKRILITAHWDSRPYADQDSDKAKQKDPVPAANDGGSGVAVMLELARILKMHPPGVGVDFIMWDAEDYGAYEVENSFCLGSQYWAKNPHKAGYKATWGINLDMVGAENPRFAMEAYSMGRASDYVRKVWTIAGKLGHSAFFSWEQDDGVIDDHLYVMETGIPMVEIIDRKHGGSFFPHWHTTGDSMDKISKQTLQAVGQTVLEVIFQEK